jgi:CubicO group peptidase (beta-lactamase class C family)
MVFVKVMSRRFILVVQFICLTLFALGQKKDLSNTVEERIKQVEGNVPQGDYEIAGAPKQTLLDRMKFHGVKGVSIAVINNYEVEWAKGYGWADSSEQRPVTPETFFLIVSISKSLNAMGILKLAQDNKIDINADINNYLTSWKFPYDSISKGKKITMAQLLSHSAGLTTSGGSDYQRGDTLPTIYDILDGKRPANSPAVRSEYEPGTRFQYSNNGSSIAMLTAMDITKKTYEDYIKETVLNPLGMNNTFFTDIPPGNLKQKFATGYNEDGTQLKGKYSILAQQAGGAAWSTPSEICKYIIEMQLSLKGKSNKILSKENTQMMVTPQIANSGLGVFVDSIGSEKYFQNGGGRRGFTSLYYGSFKDGKGVVIFVNSSNASIQKEIGYSVAMAYGWKDFYKPKTKTIIPMSVKELEEYEGEYVFSPDASVFIDYDGTGFYAAVSGQSWYNIFPEAKDKFFGQVKEVELEFVRSNHAVNKLIYKVDGRSDELKKRIALSDDELNEYVGEYVLNDTTKVLLSKDGNRIRATIQEHTFYMFPEIKDNFFVLDTQAKVEFVRTNNIVNKLIYKINGEFHEFKKK